MPDPRTLDELCALLGTLRTSVGSPSYAEIARRIGVIRGGEEPAKVTVYDCFRPGRRRVDDRLVGDILRALGTSDEEASEWSASARVLNGDRSGVHIPVEFETRAVGGSEIGRERLLASLPAADVMLLTGLPGVGKSTLATALARGDRVLSVDLRESHIGWPSADPVDVLRRMLGALGERSLPYEIGLLRERLASAADGVTCVLEDAGQAQRLLPLIVPGLRYLVTSRVDLASLAEQLRADGIRARHIAIAPLEADDAARLLVHLLTREENGTVPPRSFTAADVDRVVAVSGGLPVDIAMLAGIVREHPGWTFEDLASRFENEPRDARIRPVLDAATRALRSGDADLLADAALIDRDFDESVLLAAAGSQASAGLDRLRSRHLIERRDGRVLLHATVFAFARERSRSLRPESIRRSFVMRAGHAVLDRMAGDRDYAAKEVATVLAVATAAREHGGDELVERLALDAHPALSRWSMWNESLRLHDLATRGAGIHLIPELALGVANCAEKLGRFDEALVTLHRVRRVAEGAALARTWNQIGNVQRWMSHLDEALTSYRAAIGHARSAGDRVVEGRATGNHADTLRILARYDEAQAQYSDALAMAESEADELNTVIVRGNRALCLLAVGHLDDAENELSDLLALSRGASLPFVRRTRALIAEARGDDALARERLGEAIGVTEASAEFATSADLVLLAARIDARSGAHARAAAQARDVLRDAELAGSPLIATEAANSLAEILLLAMLADPDEHRLAEAELQAGEARSIAEATGDRAEVARSDGILARIAEARGNVEDAARLDSASRALYAKLGHRLAPQTDRPGRADESGDPVGAGEQTAQLARG